MGLHALPNFLLDARAHVRDLNEGVRKVMAPIAEIAKNHPDVATGTVHVWPPKDVGNLTFRFTMKKLAEKSFGWKLEAKPKGGEDSAYKVAMGGRFQKGELPRRGRGEMGVNLNVLKDMDSTFMGQGIL